MLGVVLKKGSSEEISQLLSTVKRRNRCWSQNNGAALPSFLCINYIELFHFLFAPTTPPPPTPPPKKNTVFYLYLMIIRSKTVQNLPSSKDGQCRGFAVDGSSLWLEHSVLVQCYMRFSQFKHCPCILTFFSTTVPKIRLLPLRSHCNRLTYLRNTFSTCSS